MQSIIIWFQVAPSASPAAAFDAAIHALPDWIRGFFVPPPKATTLSSLDQHLGEFYNAKVLLSREEAIDLCTITVQQSGCQRWREERRQRVTASRAHSILKGRKTETRLANFFKLLPDLASLRLVQCNLSDTYRTVVHIGMTLAAEFLLHLFGNLKHKL